jgi:hypothetical protein
MLATDPLSLYWRDRQPLQSSPGATNNVLTVIDEVKNLHPSIQSFEEEVKSLRRPLDAISGGLASLSPADATAKIEEIWRLIASSAQIDP